MLIFILVLIKGNDFAQKITYKTTGATPEDLIASFRNSYFPRIAVTVDMIATGTDIKPLEIVNQGVIYCAPYERLGISWIS